MPEMDDFLSILHDSNQSNYKRRDAFTKITRMNPPNLVEILAPLVTDADRYLKQDVVRYLADRGGRNAVPALVPALGDEDQSVKQMAIVALGKNGDASTITALKPFLEERSYSIRSAVETAIKNLGGLEAEPTTGEPESAPEAPMTETASTAEPETGESEPEAELEVAELEEPAPEALTEAEVETEEPAAAEEESKTEEEAGDVVEATLEVDEELADEVRDSVGAVVPDSLELVDAEFEEITDEPKAEDAELESSEVSGEEKSVDEEEPPPVPGKAEPPPIPKSVPPPIPGEEKEPDGATEESESKQDEGRALPAPEDLKALYAESVLVRDGFSWANAPRLQQYFGDRVGDIRPLYEVYWDSCKRLPKHEAIASEVFSQLQILHADKDDDLEEIRGKIKSTNHQIEADRFELRQYEDKEIRIRGQMDSFLTGLMNPLFNTETDLKLQLEEVVTQIKMLKNSISSRNDSLKKLKAEQKQLLKSMRTLEEKSNKSKEEKEDAERNMRDSSQQINQLFLDRLLGSTPRELESLFEALGKHAIDPDFLRMCYNEMLKELEEFRRNRELIKEGKGEYDAAVARCRERSSILCEELADGFTVNEESRELSINLRGHLHFEEESSFWSGYSNAQGQASGAGNATGRYAIQDISWRPGNQTVGCVNAYSKSWRELGKRAGEMEYLFVMQESGQRSLMEYVHLIRSEVERDFREES